MDTDTMYFLYLTPTPNGEVVSLNIEPGIGITEAICEIAGPEGVPLAYLQDRDPDMVYMDPVLDPTIAAAYAEGVDAAKASASWITDGTTDPEHARNVLRMMRDGDPAVDVYLPRRPNLSGEWADDPTPISLARDLTGDMGGERSIDPDPDLIDAIADAFERGVDDTFEAANEAELIRFIGADADSPEQLTAIKAEAWDRLMASTRAKTDDALMQAWHWYQRASENV